MSTRGSADKIAAQDLWITSDSDRRFSVGSPDGQPKAIRINLLKKIAKGTYNHRAAIRLYQYLADNAAKAYVKEYGGVFNKPTRELVAREMAGYFYRNRENWDDWEAPVRKNPGKKGKTVAIGRGSRVIVLPLNQKGTVHGINTSGGVIVRHDNGAVKTWSPSFLRAL